MVSLIRKRAGRLDSQSHDNRMAKEFVKLMALIEHAHLINARQLSLLQEKGHCTLCLEALVQVELCCLA